MWFVYVSVMVSYCYHPRVSRVALEEKRNWSRDFCTVIFRSRDVAWWPLLHCGGCIRAIRDCVAVERANLTRLRIAVGKRHKVHRVYIIIDFPSSETREENVTAASRAWCLCCVCTRWWYVSAVYCSSSGQISLEAERIAPSRHFLKFRYLFSFVQTNS